jgi:hypothetical protein
VVPWPPARSPGGVDAAAEHHQHGKQKRQEDGHRCQTERHAKARLDIHAWEENAGDSIAAQAHEPDEGEQNRQRSAGEADEAIFDEAPQKDFVGLPAGCLEDADLAPPCRQAVSRCHQDHEDGGHERQQMQRREHALAMRQALTHEIGQLVARHDAHARRSVGARERTVPQDSLPYRVLIARPARDEQVGRQIGPIEDMAGRLQRCQDQPCLPDAHVGSNDTDDFRNALALPAAVERRQPRPDVQMQASRQVAADHQLVAIAAAVEPAVDRLQPQGKVVERHADEHGANVFLAQRDMADDARHHLDHTRNLAQLRCRGDGDGDRAAQRLAADVQVGTEAYGGVRLVRDAARQTQANDIRQQRDDHHARGDHAAQRMQQ